MNLAINSELLKKCGGGSDEYWFSYGDYSVKNIRDFNTDERPNDMSQSAYFVSLGIIPFVSISNEEIMRAFIKEKGSQKLVNIFKDVKSDDFIETFWKYYNAYPELKNGIDEFASVYTIAKIKAWCEENSISYTTEI